MKVRAETSEVENRKVAELAKVFRNVFSATKTIKRMNAGKHEQQKGRTTNARHERPNSLGGHVGPAGSHMRVPSTVMQTRFEQLLKCIAG